MNTKYDTDHYYEILGIVFDSGGVEHWDCTSDEYHASPGLSRSMLCDFADDPEVFYRRFVTGEVPRIKTSEAMQFGHDLEDWIVNRGMPNHIMVAPAEVLTSNGQRRGNAWNAFLKANPGKRIITAAQEETLLKALAWAERSIDAHEEASTLLASTTQTAYAIRWIDEFGLLRKCQLDALTPEDIYDVKTTAYIDPDGFAKHAEGFRYHWQHAIYAEAVMRLFDTDVDPDFTFVCLHNRKLEDGGIYRCETYTLAKEWIDAAYREVEETVKRFAACVESNVWTRPSHGKLIELDRPRFAVYQQEYAV